jgi:hypothetical protein
LADIELGPDLLTQQGPAVSRFQVGESQHIGLS